MSAFKRILIAAVFALHPCTSALHAQLNLAMPVSLPASMGLNGNPMNPDGFAGIAAISFTGHSTEGANPRVSAGNAYQYIGGAETLGDLEYTASAEIDLIGFAPSISISSPSSYSIASNNSARVNLRFGSSTGTATDTWSLGSDIAGVDYYLDSVNNTEERIYQADPTKVEIGIYFNDTKVITLDYSPIYMILTYAVDPSNDSIQAYSDPVGFNVVSGLSGTAADFADALASEIDSLGGSLQLVFDTIQPASVVTGVSSTYGAPYGVFSAVGRLQAVSLTPVPEPSTYALIFGILTLGVVIYRRRMGA